MRRRLLIVIAVLAVTAAACGGGDDDTSNGDGGSDTTAGSTSGDAAAGLVLFDATCKTCHGEGGVGVDGLGKPIPGSAFVVDTSDDDLVAFIKVGRTTSDPANTTGVDMPPKGGNPSLSDADLDDIVAYLRTIQ
jgi:mono/diheme cytochrome c family protein